MTELSGGCIIKGGWNATLVIIIRMECFDLSL